MIQPSVAASEAAAAAGVEVGGAEDEARQLSEAEALDMMGEWVGRERLRS